MKIFWIADSSVHPSSRRAFRSLHWRENLVLLWTSSSNEPCTDIVWFEAIRIVWWSKEQIIFQRWYGLIWREPGPPFRMYLRFCGKSPEVSCVVDPFSVHSFHDSPLRVGRSQSPIEWLPNDTSIVDPLLPWNLAWHQLIPAGLQPE